MNGERLKELPEELRAIRKSSTNPQLGLGFSTKTHYQEWGRTEDGRYSNKMKAELMKLHEKELRDPRGKFLLAYERNKLAVHITEDSSSQDTETPYLSLSFYFYK